MARERPSLTRHVNNIKRTESGKAVKDVRATLADGQNLTFQIAPGQTLMEAIRGAAPNGVLALCGGNCSCGTCHVIVDAACLATLPAMKIDERELLECQDNCDANSRLACQLSFDALPLTFTISIPDVNC